MTTRNTRRAPAILALVLSLMACAESGSTGPRFEIKRSLAEGVWVRERPETYSFTLYRSCECLPEMTGPVTVMVNGDDVVARRYDRTGAAVTITFAGLFPNVEGMFSIIDAALERDAARIEVQYDATYGYPTRILIDYDGQWGNDDEVVYTISNFQTP